MRAAVAAAREAQRGRPRDAVSPTRGLDTPNEPTEHPDRNVGLPMCGVLVTVRRLAWGHR